MSGGSSTGETRLAIGRTAFSRSALEREDVLHVPLERGRHADEAHGFGGGRAIEHNHVVALLAPELVHVHHGAQLFHARQDRQFLGLDVADAGGAQHGDDVSRDLPPVPLDLFLDIDFVDGRGSRRWGSGSPVFAVEQAGFEIEGIGEAVSRVDAHHQRAMAQMRQTKAGGGGEAGLADAAFTAEQKDAHNTMVVGGTVHWYLPFKGRTVS